jgi:hypothetical protein
VQNNAATVSVTVRRKQPVEGDDNYSWVNTTQQRFEAFDAEGRVLRFNGVADQNIEPNIVRLTLQFVRPAGGQKPPKIAKLHLVEWAVQHKPIEFAPKDLPLPRAETRRKQVHYFRGSHFTGFATFGDERAGAFTHDR